MGFGSKLLLVYLNALKCAVLYFSLLSFVYCIAFFAKCCINSSSFVVFRDAIFLLKMKRTFVKRPKVYQTFCPLNSTEYPLICVLIRSINAPHLLRNYRSAKTFVLNFEPDRIQSTTKSKIIYSKMEDNFLLVHLIILQNNRIKSVVIRINKPKNYFITLLIRSKIRHTAFIINQFFQYLKK